MTLMHDAARAPRLDILGEVVYAQAWKDLLAYQPGLEQQLFEAILCNLTNEPTQRDAIVAASVIQWLGTNVGGQIMTGIRHLAVQQENAFFRCRFYLAAWCQGNHRVMATNHGFRLLELLMAPGDEIDAETGFPKDVPDLTVRDYEVADHVFYWLGSDDGQAFVDGCEAEIEAQAALTGVPGRSAVLFIESDQDSAGTEGDAPDTAAPAAAHGAANGQG